MSVQSAATALAALPIVIPVAHVATLLTATALPFVPEEASPVHAFCPFGRWVSQVRPDSGSTCVKPLPGGGLGMRMRWLQAGH